MRPWSTVGCVLTYGMLSIAAVAARADCPPPPVPANPVIHGPIYIDRDIETCRTFSSQIYFDPLVPPYYSFALVEVTAAELQSLAAQGFEIAFRDGFLAGEKTTAREYYNVTLAHYFMALPDEGAAIEHGDAGPGWTATGFSFEVRKPVTSPLSRYVYRFYGSISPGPNSHFFTMSADENRALLTLFASTPSTEPRWHSEGVAFNAFPVTADGVCVASRLPVWRAFNGGFARGVESNHRFSTERSVMDGMIAMGWIDEGIAFCVDAQ